MFNFVKTAFVAAVFKWGLQKCIDNFSRQFAIDSLAAEAKDIGVIMLAGQGRGFFIGNKRGANAGNLVGHDAHADARAADENAVIVFMLGDALRDRLAIKRVVGRVFGISDEIAD